MFIALISSFSIVLAQLSPVQLQKVKADFDAALKSKKFDEAQTYLNRIEKGGRRAYALELSVELAKARQKEAEEKQRAQLHKQTKEKAEEVMQLRKVEQQHQNLMEQFYKAQAEKEKQELKTKLEATQKELEELKKQNK